VNLEELRERVDGILKWAKEEAKKVVDQDSFNRFKGKFTGKKGVVSELRRTIDFKSLSSEERRRVGELLNYLSDKAKAILEECKDRLLRVDSGRVDVTERPVGVRTGSLHPVEIVKQEIVEVFSKLGFFVMEGREVESDFYNFESLNIPQEHPARDMQDTFYLTNGLLLRTHTSACQVRAMKKFQPPFKAIFPGKCFRYENVDASHETTFYQLEGLMIDRRISVANLIAIMKLMLEEVFMRELEVRLRPGFFPFVEPGFELDIKCLLCGGKGCSACKGSGWLELLPCGLVHPKVLEYGGLDPAEWQGFAFGLGLTRMAMMKYGIGDIRVFMSGDLRVLTQFESYPRRAWK